MRILFVAAEASPLVKVGGLADVIGSLPRALAKLGHDVRLAIPLYGSADLRKHDVDVVEKNIEIPMSGAKQLATVKATDLWGELCVYLIYNPQYFGGNEVYGARDQERFLFFSRSVVEILQHLHWQPQIVHCHDWHTALTVMWLKEAEYPAPVIFTIHNLAYQGEFDRAFLSKFDLERHWASLPSGTPKMPLKFMGQGILWADKVTTVSETYAKEIVTPTYGAGLEHLLRYRQKDLIGIVNGIDYEEYNPKKDPHIPSNYDSSTIDKRASNKLALQRRAGLTQDTDIPLIGMIQRLEEQKGINILEKAIDDILKVTRAQFVILGKGRQQYQELLIRKAVQNPQQLAAFIAFDNDLAHLIYAGCDMFLMPSRFEPCGLGQLIAMRYGALPIVRHTGGLADTVHELTPDLKEGNGFVFQEYTPEALASAVKEAIDVFTKNRAAWQHAAKRAMQLDFSWKASARKYEAVYQRVLEANSQGQE